MRLTKGLIKVHGQRIGAGSANPGGYNYAERCDWHSHTRFASTVKHNTLLQLYLSTSAFITDRTFLRRRDIRGIISSVAVSHGERPIFTEGGIRNLISFSVGFLARVSVYLAHARRHNNDVRRRKSRTFSLVHSYRECSSADEGSFLGENVWNRK